MTIQGILYSSRENQGSREIMISRDDSDSRGTVSFKGIVAKYCIEVNLGEIDSCIIK